MLLPLRQHALGIAALKIKIPSTMVTARKIKQNSPQELIKLEQSALLIIQIAPGTYAKHTKQKTKFGTTALQ
tara:strand:- start:89 stop:304 length:216 start_codon:yes stop_codon:yes gene_type:complete